MPAASVARGAYVDMNYTRNFAAPLATSFFSGPPHLKSRLLQLANGAEASVYDTWPLHYERNGIDEDRDNAIDEGTNGLDDPPIENGVDDVGERETAAPYGVPLRGLQVTLRVMDANTRQVRQVSVVGDFMPE
jgi:hypothetical protein